MTREGDGTNRKHEFRINKFTEESSICRRNTVQEIFELELQEAETQPCLHVEEHIWLRHRVPSMFFCSLSCSSLDSLVPGLLSPWTPWSLDSPVPGLLGPWTPWSPDSLVPGLPGPWTPWSLDSLVTGLSGPWTPWSLDSLVPGLLSPWTP